jgi:hypothetical protein
MSVIVGLVIVVVALMPVGRDPRGIWSTLAYQRRRKLAAGEATCGAIFRMRLSYVVRAGFVVVGLLHAGGALS